MSQLETHRSNAGHPDTDHNLNLGAETPSSILKLPSSTLDEEMSSDNSSTPRGRSPSNLDLWTRSGIAPTSDLPTRPRDWRSKSYDRKQKEYPKFKKAVERDCGICFEFARNGCRTPCCRSLFCLEHINDWLTGPSSNGKCPSCETPCTIKNGSVTINTTPSQHLPSIEIPPRPRASSYEPSPLPSPYSGPHESTVDVNPIGGN